MTIIKGRPVFGGIAKGIIVFFHRDEITVNKLKISDPELEYSKYLYAKNSAISELKELFDQTTKEIGRIDAEIFSIHQMILNDSQFDKLVKDYILNQKFNADYAVARTAQTFANLIANMESDYIKERAADVKDVSDRLLRHIQNRGESSLVLSGRSIICADDLMPSETVSLDRARTAAFCTCGGSTNSHTAILARTMNIPAIVGIGAALSEEYDGKYAIVDGYSGTLYIEPDEKTARLMEQKADEEGRKRELLHRFKGRRNITRDGREFEVYANIGSLADVEYALENDAGGVGLFRSEFMYLQRDSFPNEETLFYNYRRVLEDMKGKRVVIRTLDIGADKTAAYFGLEEEANPALGIRAVRLCLRNKEIFTTQLRALYRASIYGKLAIMIPMIVDINEFMAVKEVICQVQQQLLKEKIPFSTDVEVGVMIETPAAVMTSDLLAKQADFVSIGTNDLEQYTYAVDRQHPEYEMMMPQNHIATLRMIKSVCDNAHAYGKKVCICGEMGADPNYIEIFLDMHVDRLSVAPPNILPVRKLIRSIDLSDRRKIHNNIQSALGYD